MRNRIIGALQSASDANAKRAANEIDQEFVFVHPTIQRLSSAIAALVDPSAAIVHGKVNIKDLIAKYSADLPASKFANKPTSTSDFVVLLTGSTGSLGAHVLVALLEDPKVAKVYTLNRGSDVAERQRLSFVDKDLPTDLLASKKLVQLTADLSRDDLGLESAVLNEIKSSATHFIHNAWKVDFNLSLSSFESYIAATRQLVDLSTQFSNNVKFLFTSSIAVATGWDNTKGPVPETIINNEEILDKIGRGYEGSKYVVEHVRLVSLSVLRY